MNDPNFDKNDDVKYESLKIEVIKLLEKKIQKSEYQSTVENARRLTAIATNTHR